MGGIRQSLKVREMLVTDTLIGLVSPAVFLWFSPNLTWRWFTMNVIAGQLYSHCIGTLVHVSLVWAYPRIAHWKPSPRWISVLGILAADTAVGCALAVLTMSVVGFYDPMDFWSHFSSAFRVGLVITLVFGVSGAVSETMRSRLEAATVQLRVNERERERALRLATEARLSSLESRVHPHFLFNALNSISSLIHEDPDRAERLIERMAALLRFSLDAQQLGLVTLAQEIEIVRAYLEIEKARFGQRLSYSIDVPQELHAYLVPALSVQTLVENSVKYTVAPERLGGGIVVSARGVEDALEIEVRDEGPGFDLTAVAPGHGLDLLQSRLQILFGDHARLRAEGSSVTISVPCSAPISSTTRS